MAKNHRNRIRSSRELARRAPFRTQYEKILIICEGEKTEPNYFEEIRISKRLSTANIRIKDSSYGSDPLNVVNFAIAEFNKTQNWDRIYCVFDQDNHQGFLAAINKIAETSLKNMHEEKVIFEAIVSVPCFEIWLLLHHTYTSGQMTAKEVIKRLNSCMPYNKGTRGIYEKTSHKIEDAYKNVKKLNKEHQIQGAIRTFNNPSTKVGNLVHYLLHLK
ncbi:MAG: hypothetical protein K0S11_1123 [Gammaproteobacteria bacterium]|jgi:hypothetical protein|nr:hypothetical protein [Gammaproteobacteria bacterium]